MLAWLSAGVFALFMRSSCSTRSASEALSVAIRWLPMVELDRAGFLLDVFALSQRSLVETLATSGFPAAGRASPTGEADNSVGGGGETGAREVATGSGSRLTSVGAAIGRDLDGSA